MPLFNLGVSMETVKEVRTRLAAMEKSTSLLQISKGSKINYITLRKIKAGVTQRISTSVLKRFNDYSAAFGTGAAPAVPKKAGKAKPAAKKAAPVAAKGRGKKKAAGAVAPTGAKTAPKRRGPAPKVVAAAPAPEGAAVPAPKRRGRKPKSVSAATATPKKKGARRGRKPGTVVKNAAVNVPASAPLVLSDRLKAEIAATKKYLAYLMKLEELETEFHSLKK